jgi:hypothetical protein
VGATSEKLREVLKRDGEVIRCPELATSFLRAASLKMLLHFPLETFNRISAMKGDVIILGAIE